MRFRLRLDNTIFHSRILFVIYVFHNISYFTHCEVLTVLAVWETRIPNRFEIIYFECKLQKQSKEIDSD